MDDRLKNLDPNLIYMVVIADIHFARRLRLHMETVSGTFEEKLLDAIKTQGAMLWRNEDKEIQ